MDGSGPHGAKLRHFHIGALRFGLALVSDFKSAAYRISRCVDGKGISLHNTEHHLHIHIILSYHKFDSPIDRNVVLAFRSMW